MARLRTFIAVDPGKAIRARCLELQESLTLAAGDVKWVEEPNLHLTLLFLGEVNDREVPKVCKTVAECCMRQRAFNLSIERAGCFPNPRRPRIIWAGVGDGAAELVALHAALEAPLLDLGCYRREERQFTPHITLGRRKSDKDAATLAGSLEQQAAWQGGSALVREVLVLSSQLNRDGPSYTVLSRAKLASQ